MPAVLLATFSLMPDGEPGGSLLEPLAARGVSARWARWDDASVDWAAADLVAVRSTWDYHRRLPDFLAWARAVEASTPLLNGAGVFAWNADKRYLLDLADLVPTVPTALIDETTLVDGLASALGRWGAVVVKPRTGASGLGVVVVEEPLDHRLQGLAPAPWVVQPLVASVRTVGEVSVFVLDGEAVARVDKRPGAGEIRVHEVYGGASRPGALDAATADLARAAVAAAARRTGGEIAYARVDLMQWDGAWAVSEVELIEPGLYLDLVPGNAAAFADVVARRVLG